MSEPHWMIGESTRAGAAHGEVIQVRGDIAIVMDDEDDTHQCPLSDAVGGRLPRLVRLPPPATYTDWNRMLKGLP